MIESKVRLEVHCTQPDCVEQENSSYRLYFNGELLTERSWLWDRATYIEEIMTLDREPYVDNNFCVEVIKSQSNAITKFIICNLRVNDRVRSSYNDLSDTITFRIE
jgi:hypothetical protein